jgi:uncharacterized protein YjbJ (UPF0337 family)
MDEDRVKGSAQHVKGSMKEAGGKLLGDEKLKAEGKMDKVEGKIRNTVGGMKDSIRDAAHDHDHNHGSTDRTGKR